MLLGSIRASSTHFHTPTPIGVSFSPAGLLTPFHLGVAQRLQELGIITQSTTLAGSSGGAIAAAVTAVGLSSNDTLAACNRIAQKCRDSGTFRTLSTSFQTEIQALLPESVSTTLNTRQGRTILGYRQIWPQFQSHFVSEFASKADVCEVITASCTIPFYFSGSLAVDVRGGYGVDGFFSLPSRFGCPDTSSNLELVVTPFRPEVLGLGGFISTPSRRVDIISPALLLNSRWPYSSSELIRLALAPPSASGGYGRSVASDSQIKAQYEVLFAAGVDCVDAWCVQVPEGTTRSNAEAAAELAAVKSA